MNNNELIRKIIFSQKDFHLLPRNKDGYCVYNGSLYCRNKHLSILPDKLIIKGVLDCNSNGLNNLPNNLIVKGNLYCCNNGLKYLPDNLIIYYNLDCRYNKITKFIKSNINGKIHMDDEQKIKYERSVKINKLLEKLK